MPESLASLRQKALEGRLDPDAIAALAADSRRGARDLAARVLAQQAAQAAEQARLLEMLQFEAALWRAGTKLVAGVDEVGVGPLAGPVVAAAVIMPVDATWAGIDDSKRLSEPMRRQLDARIRDEAVAWAIGECTPDEIDSTNIFVATRQAARRAVEALRARPQHILVDAHRIPQVRPPQTCIVHGDSRSQSIAAASIVAKVARDAYMRLQDGLYPGYGFAQHVGYGTAQHLAALQRLGPCPLHRHSYAPVRQAAAARSDR